MLKELQSHNPNDKIQPRKVFNLSRPFEKATAGVMASARKEIMAAAKAHGVSINADGIMSASVPGLVIVHAPLTDIEKYKDADFAAGAPIQLVIVESTTKGEIPNGAYVVKAQYKPGATSGKAIFTDSGGRVVAQRNLIVRSAEQSAVLFPDVYSNPQFLPVATSVHVLRWDETLQKYRYYIDCAGWIPYRVIYY